MSDLRFNPDEMQARGYDSATIEEAQRASEARNLALELIERIKRCFVEIPRPVVTLSVARGYDDEWNLSDERVAELSAQDPEQHWFEVGDAAIEHHQEYFTFSNPEGCRFYLPAFLCHYLREFPYSGHTAVYDACVWPRALTDLSNEERACVNEFLELCYAYQRH